VHAGGSLVLADAFRFAVDVPFAVWQQGQEASVVHVSRMGMPARAVLPRDPMHAGVRHSRSLKQKEPPRRARRLSQRRMRALVR
jgi:hypothetical protein